VKSPVQNALGELKTALEGTDMDEVRAKLEALTQASMKLGEALYAASQAEEGAEGGSSESAEGDDVVDADFEEVDDENKKDAS
jgi:molecular chaperone DnaK